MTSPVFTPLQMFYSTSGLPLTDGYIYIGTASQNPQTNPIAVYWDAAGTIPAAQPIRTSGGYPVRNGSPATVFVLATDFSLIVRDKSSKLVFSRLSGNAFSAEWVTYNPAGTGAVLTTVQAKLRESVSVLDYLPASEKPDVIAGTSTYDIGDAVRHAIDALGPNGGTVVFPNGGAGKILAPVYIPPKGYGVTLEGNRFTVSGGGYGINNIFETGMTGNSYGGSSNWSAPNETILNQGLVIRNFNFLECGVAIKAFNAIWRSEFSGNWGYTNCKTLLHAKRCFYSKTLYNATILGNVGRAQADPNYWFEEAVNVQTIAGNSAAGTYGGANKSGTGYLFTGGIAGLEFANNSAEGCFIGLKITGEVTGAKINGCYFEFDDIGIYLGAAGKTMDIGGCFFYSNVLTAIQSNGGWVAGVLESSNSIDAACLVDLSGASNTMVVELAPQQLDMTTAYLNYKNVPTNWTLPAGARISRPAATFDAGTGIAAQRALLSQETNANGITALPYAGDIGASSGANPPFGYATIISGTSVYVDTKIVYRDTGIAAFTAIITDNGSVQRKIAGFVRFGTTVFRLDAVTATVTASNASGFLRLIFSGFASNPLASINDIRVWVG